MAKSNQFFVSYYKPDHQPHGLIQFATHVPRSISVADARVLVEEINAALAEHKEGDPDKQK